MRSSRTDSSGNHRFTTDVYSTDADPSSKGPASARTHEEASEEAPRTEAKSSSAPTPWRACRGAALREISLASGGDSATSRSHRSVVYAGKFETPCVRREQQRLQCENKRAGCPSAEHIGSRRVATHLRCLHGGIPSPWKPASTTALPSIMLPKRVCEPGEKIQTRVDTYRGGSEVSPHLRSDEKFFVTGPVRTNPRTVKPSPER